MKNENEIIYITNEEQTKFYVKNGVLPINAYMNIDGKRCFLFTKKDTQKLYNVYKNLKEIM